MSNIHGGEKARVGATERFDIRELGLWAVFKLFKYK
jgi:hypothetical protein